MKVMILLVWLIIEGQPGPVAYSEATFISNAAIVEAAEQKCEEKASMIRVALSEKARKAEALYSAHNAQCLIMDYPGKIT